MASAFRPAAMSLDQGTMRPPSTELLPTALELTGTITYGMTAASWPEDGSFQKVHLVRIVKSPIPLLVSTFPEELNVSRTKSWVPVSMSRLSVTPKETRVGPRARARYWLGAAESGSTPREMASMRMKMEPGPIVA